MIGNPPISPAGRLVLIVGPSGVGKDALISYCRRRLVDGDRIVFPRRVITRAAGDGSEDHETVSDEEFTRCRSRGGFSLSWRAHGLAYGIPVSIARDLAAGRTVVVNVSRSVIDEARRRYHPLLVIAVSASQEIIASRLVARSREAPEDIARRLARTAFLDMSAPDVVSIDNSGALDEAGETLLHLLRSSPV